MSADLRARIVVRRKKVVAAAGHHGGAWKVAYADFVTAMMAFFLLMWLLNATTEKQRKGLADYFSESIPINRVSGGGKDIFWGDNIYAEEEMIQSGAGASRDRPTDYRQARGDSGVDLSDQKADARDEQAASGADRLLEELIARGGESVTDLLNLPHVIARVSDEGLVIEIAEADGQRLWSADGKAATPVMAGTLAAIAEVLDLVTNGVAINAHVASRPIVLANNSAWDLSSSRAGAARELLEIAGLPPSRVQRVSGFGDRKPATSKPTARGNNRLEIVVLRSGA